MNDNTAASNRAVATFWAIPWSIPIPITSYLLIAAGRGEAREEEVGADSTVKNHDIFSDIRYSLRVIIIFCPR